MKRILDDGSQFTTPHPDGLITPREAKVFLRVSSTTLYKLCREGKLPPVKFSRRCTRFRVADLMKLIDNAPSKGGE